jgi:imidazolonepropionase-like amidohydrolase
LADLRSPILAGLLVLWALLALSCTGETAAPPEPDRNAPETRDRPVAPPPDDPGIEADLVLTGGTLIDGTGTAPVPDAVVAVRDGRIVAVGPADELEVAPGVRTLDVGGRSVLPGLVNAHAHTSDLSAGQMKTWTRAGVTTVLDLAGPPEPLLERRRALESSGDPQLPRLLVSGPMITVPGGHPIPIYGPDYPALAVEGPQDAREQVKRLLEAGVDHVKIAVSGRTDTGWPELSDEEIRTITETAHRGGVRVSVHVDRAAGVRRAVENGADVSAHLPRDRVPDDLIRLMVRRDVALVPTIDVYENLVEESGTAAGWRATTLPVMQDNLRRFVAAGGTLALGDDYGNPGVELGLPADEIEQWTAAGLTPQQIIPAATRNAAAVCGLESELGTLEEGKVADILVVEGDPLSDIRALERPFLVIRGGEVAYRS